MQDTWFESLLEISVEEGTILVPISQKAKLKLYLAQGQATDSWWSHVSESNLSLQQKADLPPTFWATSVTPVSLLTIDPVEKSKET